MPAASDRRAAINRRMKLQENKISQEQVLIQLRKERGLEGGASLLLLRPVPRAAHAVGPGHADAAFLTITSGVALGAGAGRGLVRACRCCSALSRCFRSPACCR